MAKAQPRPFSLADFRDRPVDALIYVGVQIALGLVVVAKTLAQAALSAYREAKHLIGTGFRRGWRPLFPWVAIWIFAGLGWRIVNGLPIPGVVELLGVLGPITLPTMLAYWTRSVETRAGVANLPPFIGNMVNPHGGPSAP